MGARACGAFCAILLLAGAAAGATLPAGFGESVVYSGLDSPTALAFAPDGRVFVAEKRGTIQVFASVDDPTPQQVADLRTLVHNYWDRGLLGLAVHPDFPRTPYVYVAYTFDAPIGGTAPVWGSPGVSSDACPNRWPPNGNGCLASGRLSRLRVEGNVAVAEEVLIEGWCQESPSHSLGSVAFGPDGALYVSGGDGASFNGTDFGQFGDPPNRCGDPPAGVGGLQAPPDAMGGALRAQSPERPAGLPAVLNGTIARVDPNSGAALPDNPLVGSANPGAERVVAYGLRNPFRIAPRPGTSEIWIGDVGWETSDEINRLLNPTAAAQNFGWPCYEGPNPQAAYGSLGLRQCEALYARPGAVTPPVFAYGYFDPIVSGEICKSGTQSISGLAFYGTGTYPAAYQGALFFADYSRECIWVMFPGANGDPDPATRATFAIGAEGPVDLQIGPGGDLFYVELNGGTVRRVRSTAVEGQPPVAVVTAVPTSGSVPLTVRFDATQSHVQEPGGTLSYAWDLNGDGAFDDGNGATAEYVYTIPGAVTASVRVTDSRDRADTASVVIQVGSAPPLLSIQSPSAMTRWRVGDTLTLSGSATDAIGTPLPPSALTWSVILHHCPETCHTHTIQQLQGVAQATIDAPDHEYPSYLEIRLSAVDADGLSATTSVELQPQTATVAFDTVPSGLALVVGSERQSTPFQRTAIVGGALTIGAPVQQMLGGTTYLFEAWSDGGDQTHAIIVADAPGTLVATFAALLPTPTATPLPPTPTDTAPPTATDTAESSTPTPLPVPTATATVPNAAPCPSDCDGDGAVTVDELISAVSIALDVTPLDACPAADVDGDGSVMIAELVEGTNAALDGCPGQPGAL